MKMFQKQLEIEVCRRQTFGYHVAILSSRAISDTERVRGEEGKADTYIFVS